MAQWTKRQFEGKGLFFSKFSMEFFEPFISSVIMLENGALSTLLPYEQHETVSGHSTRWVIAAITLLLNLAFVAVFRAEVAPMHARRYDLVGLATLYVGAYFATYFVAFGHVRHLAGGLFHSYSHLLLWMWLVPITISTAARGVYRRELRYMRLAKIKKKLKNV